MIEEIFQIHQTYCKRVPVDSESAPVVLKVMNQNETNQFEHNSIKSQMLVKFGVEMVDMDFRCFEGKLSLNETNGKLYYKSKEVSVVYFRTGYQEDLYKGDNPQILRFRELTEKSLAINVPSVKVHILNSKIVQKFLMMDSFLEILQLKPENVANIRKHTIQILNVLSDFDSDKTGLIKKIQKNPDE